MFENKNRIVMVHSLAIGVRAYNRTWDLANNNFIQPRLKEKYPEGYKQAIVKNDGMSVVWDVHVNKNKWSGTGYYYVIELDGTGKFSEKGKNKTRAIACGFTDKKYGDMNNHCYHIALSGNGDHEEATSLQMIELLRFLTEYKDMFDFIVEHKDYTKKPKSCPGNVLGPQLKKILTDNGFNYA